MDGNLGFICTQGAGVGVENAGQKGGEKNIFLASSQTIPRSLSGFDTRPRWLPVTQIALFQRSYKKNSGL